MTHKENITAILECYFTGFKEEIIDSACNRILEQESRVPSMFYPPCEDCNKKMDDIRKAYDKLQDRLSVIEDIKAEIEKQIERDFAYAEIEEHKVTCHYGTANGLQVAIRIIDKYIGGNTDE